MHNFYKHKHSLLKHKRIHFRHQFACSSRTFRILHLSIIIIFLVFLEVPLGDQCLTIYDQRDMSQLTILCRPLFTHTPSHTLRHRVRAFALSWDCCSVPWLPDVHSDFRRKLFSFTASRHKTTEPHFLHTHIHTHTQALTQHRKRVVSIHFLWPTS